MNDSAPTPVDRPALLRRAIALEWFTVAWMIIEAAVGIWAGVAVDSLSIIAFGIDSLILFASAAVLLWRLISELHQHAAFADVTEQTARRLAGVLLLALAVYIVVGAGWRLWHQTGQRFSLAGFVVVAITVPLMSWLSHRKLALADALGSRALHADAAQSIACGYLSFAVCIGLIFQLALGAWWVDVATALAILYFVIQEGREALAGEGDA